MITASQESHSESENQLERINQIWLYIDIMDANKSKSEILPIIHLTGPRLFRII